MNASYHLPPKLQVRKLRLREVKGHAQGHPATEGRAGAQPRPLDTAFQLLPCSALNHRGDLTTRQPESKERAGFQGEGGEVLGTCGYLQDAVWVAAGEREPS